MPRAAAARAAPTVPERSTTPPRFWPALIPDKTTLGLTPSWSRAAVIVSAGQPVTAVASYPLAVLAGAVVKVPGVVLPPAPLLLLSGATTTTLVFFCVRSASTSVSMPGAPTPSSLVTSTVMVAGFLFLAADAGVASATDPDASAVKTSAASGADRKRRM